jgi:hypothetical protein
MNPAVRALLDLHDDATGFEVPNEDWSAFPYQQLVDSVQAIQRELLEKLGLAFQRDGQVQDAAFHDELTILRSQEDGSSGVSASVLGLAIRFSNFGRLYTMRSVDSVTLNLYPVDAIRALVASQGWTYVADADLAEVYDGRNDALRDGRTTWWTRFFYYV